MPENDSPIRLHAQGKTIVESDKTGHLLKLNIKRLVGGEERVRKSFFCREPASRLVSEKSLHHVDELFHQLHVW